MKVPERVCNCRKEIPVLEGSIEDIVDIQRIMVSLTLILCFSSVKPDSIAIKSPLLNGFDAFFTFAEVTLSIKTCF